MRNRLREKWAAGEPTLGAWLTVPNPITVRLMKRHAARRIGVMLPSVLPTIRQSPAVSGAPDFRERLLRCGALRGRLRATLRRSPVSAGIDQLEPHQGLGPSGRRIS